LATSPMKITEIENKLTYFEIPLHGPCYIAMLADMDELRSDEGCVDHELHAFALYNITLYGRLAGLLDIAAQILNLSQHNPA
ncbi:hypothetical protein ACQKI4_17165, partial [Paenibacillus glucanolyticus]